MAVVGIVVNNSWLVTNEAIAVTPAQAAESLVEFIGKFGLGMTGEYWAPRGPRRVLSSGLGHSCVDSLFSGTLGRRRRFWVKPTHTTTVALVSLQMRDQLIEYVGIVLAVKTVISLAKVNAFGRGQAHQANTCYFSCASSCKSHDP